MLKKRSEGIDNGIVLEQGKIKVFRDLEHIKEVYKMVAQFYFTQIGKMVDILCTKQS